MIAPRVRFVVVVAALAATALLAVPGTAAAQAQPTCFGREATIVRGDGNDVVDGTNGDDVIVTGAGEDRVDGRRGRDRICSGLGDDDVLGRGGADLIDGGWGFDALSGGSGGDQAVGGPVLLTRWECIGDQWHQVTYDMSTVPATKVDDFNTGQPCSAPPPPPVDRAATLDNDMVRGGAGRDRLVGGGGNDGMQGDSGNDRLFGQVGDDGLNGGSGNDRIAAGPVFATRWECRGGTWHQVTYDQSVTPPAQVADVDTGAPCDSAAPPIDPTDDDAAAGGTGADLVTGGFGNDVLFGQSGRDRLRGGSGEDVLRGGRGRDSCAQGEATQSC
jgi:Ca2+-binding RTX toxin-like protein